MKYLRKTTLFILIACFATAFTTLLAACDMPTGNSGSKSSSSAHIHELTEVAEVAATCSSEGTKAYYRCSGCDNLFADANGEIEIDEPEKTEKIAHTEEDIPGKAPTCTQVGYTGGKRCSVCHEILVEPEELPMIAHTEEDIPGKAPTCTQVGYIGGKRCSVCHEILVEPEELPMIDHTREAIPDKEATCTQDGHTGGEWCSVCHEIFVEPTVTTAGGHKFVDGSCVHGCGYHYLTLVDATAEGLEKTDGVYIVKEGTNVTIKAAFDPECLFAGFERDGIAGSYSQTGDCYEYTFTMPASAVTYKAVYRNATDLTLKSTLVKNAITVERYLSTYTGGGNGVTFNQFLAIKGCASDGTNIYAIMNARLGTSTGSGFDIGMVAKFDKNGNFLNVTTEYAFQWGNSARLACVDGKVFVTGTNATADSADYYDTKAYKGKTLAFDADLKLISDDYSFNFPDAPQGKIVTHLAERADGYLGVIYDTSANAGNYTLCIYKKNANGEYELFSESSSPAIARAYNDNRWISGLWLGQDHVYALYTQTNQISIKLLDYMGNVVLERGLSSTAETDAASSNYQGVFEIDGKLYYTIANWSKYQGLGIYEVERKFTYELAEDENLLTVKNATVDGHEGGETSYMIERGAVVTVRANEMGVGYVFVGFEKNNEQNNFVSDLPAYTFTMPSRAITLEAIYDYVSDLKLTATEVKNKLSVNRSLSTYTDGGSGVTYSSFFLTKGTTTDGNYIYAILNNNTGTNTGFDIGIIAKFDLKGNLLATTDNAFQFGNAPRLAYVDGKLFVTGTNATANSSAYGNTKAYSAKALAFDMNLKLVNDDYSFNFPGAPQGKIVTHLTQRADGRLCVIYDTRMSGGEYEMKIYDKIEDGEYALIAENSSSVLSRASNGNRWISGVCLADNLVYVLYTNTKAFQLKVLDYSGTVIFDKGLASSPSVGSKYNFQGMFEIDGKIYYSLANWDDSYKGLGVYNIDFAFSYTRIRENTVKFNTNGSDYVVAPQYVLTGGKAELPETPTFVYTNPNGVTYNFVFDGWYSEGEPWDFDSNVIMGDITLKARWTLDDEFFAVKQNASVRAEDTTIRAMSFNVLCDDYNNKPAVAPRVPGVVNTILRYMPDVIGLQECDDQWYAALAADSSLSAKFKFINYDSTAQNKVTYGSTKYTNYSTIMYNKDVLELVEWTQQLHNPPCGNYNCRVFTIAVFRIKQSGKLFIFTSTHLALSVNERVDQVNNMKPVIDQWKAKYPDVPFMMSGDYNANESEISIINLMSQNDLFDSKNAKVKGTVCRTGHISNGMLTVSRDPAIPSHWILGRASVTSKNLTTIECIDHILLSNGVESLYYDTIHDSEALDTSDHMPIYCDVKF